MEGRHKRKADARKLGVAKLTMERRQSRIVQLEGERGSFFRREGYRQGSGESGDWSASRIKFRSGFCTRKPRWGNGIRTTGVVECKALKVSSKTRGARRREHSFWLAGRRVGSNAAGTGTKPDRKRSLSLCGARCPEPCSKCSIFRQERNSGNLVSTRRI